VEGGEGRQWGKQEGGVAARRRLQTREDKIRKITDISRRRMEDKREQRFTEGGENVDGWMGERGNMFYICVYICMCVCVCVCVCV